MTRILSILIILLTSCAHPTLFQSNTCAIDAVVNHQQVRLQSADIWCEIMQVSWEEWGDSYSHHFLVWEHPRTGTLWVSDQYGSSDTHLLRGDVTNWSGVAFVGLMARGRVVRAPVLARLLDHFGDTADKVRR